MKFPKGTRTRIFEDVTLEDVDPSGSTVELKIDSTWHPANWQGSATSTTVTVGQRTSTVYYQTAQTTDYFAGPDADQTGATSLALGQHTQEARVTKGQDILTKDLPVFTVA